MKKQCIILGNCQAEALPSYLKLSNQFICAFEIVELPGIYRMSPQEFIDDHTVSLSQAGLLIYQPLSEKFGLLSSNFITSLISDSCMKVSIPSLFFTGYNPEVAYLRDNTLKTLHYIDRIFWKLWTSGSQGKLPKKINSETLFPTWFSESCVRTSIEEAKSREISKDISIPMSDFIENNFQKHRLFHVLNHPTSITMAELSNRILSHLGFTDRLPLNLKIDEGVMKNFSFPIYNSHHRNLNLSFERGKHIYFEDLSVEKYIEIFSKRLDEISSLIESQSHHMQFSFVPPVSRSEDHIIGEMESELIFGSDTSGVLSRILMTIFPLRK